MVCIVYNVRGSVCAVVLHLFSESCSSVFFDFRDLVKLEPDFRIKTLNQTKQYNHNYHLIMMANGTGRCILYGLV